MKEKSLEKKSFLEKIGIIERVPLDEVASESLETETKVTNDTDIENSEIELMHLEDIKKENKNKEEEVIKEREVLIPMDKNLKELRMLLQSEDIFNKFNVNSVGTNTIFVIENYLKALPDYLPLDVKKESVINIISSSQIPLNLLMEDGKKKIDSLNKYSKDFSNYIKTSLEDYEKELENLKEKIRKCNDEINSLNRLNSEQLAVIEYENERINNIFDFIK